MRIWFVTDLYLVRCFEHALTLGIQLTVCITLAVNGTLLFKAAYMAPQPELWWTAVLWGSAGAQGITDL